MKQFKMIFNLDLTGRILIFVGISIILNNGIVSPTRIVQRSNGCGPHPLLALVAASKSYGSGSPPSITDVLRSVKSDPEIWATMSGLLRRYDDCIRASDGLHYKRNGGSDSSSSSSSSSSSLLGRFASPGFTTVDISGVGTSPLLDLDEVSSSPLFTSLLY